MKYNTDVKFLEGTTTAGRTTVGAVKVVESDRKLHIISGLDLGTIEKNIIQSELVAKGCSRIPKKGYLWLF